MWSPNELLKIEKQRDILSYITLQFFHFKKVPLEHCPLVTVSFLLDKTCPRHARAWLRRRALPVADAARRGWRSGQNMA